MKDLARRARIKILYDNKDISKDLAQYLKSFSYNDVISGQADDLSITLEDRTGLWKNDWLPEKGATLVVSIITQAWWKDTFSEEELSAACCVSTVTETGTGFAFGLMIKSLPAFTSLYITFVIRCSSTSTFS